MTGAIREFGRFAAVGAAATATHVGVALALVESGAAGFPAANVVAFCVALVLSYLGNHGWTFGAVGAHARRFPRFAAVATMGLTLNQLIVYLTVGVAGWNYRVALAVVVLVVPGLSFAANRRWVFSGRRLVAPERSS